jgi:cytochrome c oxidase subunit 4
MTDEVAVQVKGYIVVFGALLALTLLTVAASTLQMPGTPAVAIGLSVAAVKASLVALFFMHLRHERRLVHATLALTAVIFAGLIAFTLLTEADHAPGTRFTPAFDSAERVR